MDKDIPKIECTTITTYRNTKTGEVSKEKIEGPDIVFQKVMNQKNDKPKS
jgi:hypothetical protein